VILALKREC